MAAVVVLLLAGFFVYKRMTRTVGGKRYESLYYYDLKTGKLFPGTIKAYPPIDSESGANLGARAYVYTCGTCTEGEMKTVFINMFTPEAHAVMVNPNSQPNDVAQAQDAGEVVAAPPDVAGQAPKWVLRISPAGQELENKFRTLCNGQPAVSCLP